jgi:AraC-like DNA-binding protein
MYDPIPDGIDRNAEAVRYSVHRPPAGLSEVVHCYWDLRTEHPLADDFQLHAVPDACVNILFNQLNTDIAGITALRTRHVVLNLGRSFHYAGIQLLPGVWQGDPSEIANSFVGTPYTGSLPLIDFNRQLAPLDLPHKHAVMTRLVHQLVDAKIVVRNPVIEAILVRLDQIRSVADMASVAGLSTRQLQRALKQSTGFPPHDLLKVLRVQQSFKRHYLDLYADQAHYIHSFRNVTGYTPGKYRATFDV